MKKLRNILPSPLVALKAVGCPCGWFVAARSLAELESVGWAHMITSKDTVGFVCATCRTEVDHYRAQGAAESFAKLPAAPPHAFPRIGGKGRKHANTSRPVGAKVQRYPKNLPPDTSSSVEADALNAEAAIRAYRMAQEKM